jgi:hypothetical protein
VPLAASRRRRMRTADDEPRTFGLRFVDAAPSWEVSLSREPRYRSFVPAHSPIDDPAGHGDETGSAQHSLETVKQPRRPDSVATRRSLFDDYALLVSNPTPMPHVFLIPLPRPAPARLPAPAPDQKTGWIVRQTRRPSAEGYDDNLYHVVREEGRLGAIDAQVAAVNRCGACEPIGTPNY